MQCNLHGNVISCEDCGAESYQGNGHWKWCVQYWNIVKANHFDPYEFTLKHPKDVTGL